MHSEIHRKDVMHKLPFQKRAIKQEPVSKTKIPKDQEMENSSGGCQTHISAMLIFASHTHNVDGIYNLHGDSCSVNARTKFNCLTSSTFLSRFKCYRAFSPDGVGFGVSSRAGWKGGFEKSEKEIWCEVSEGEGSWMIHTMLTMTITVEPN